MGVPLPGGVDALLIYLAAHHPEHAYWYALLTTISSVAGNVFLYWLARRGGQAYLDRHTMSGRGKRFRTWFQHYGLLAIFIPGIVPLIPLPMKVFVLCAGAMGIRVVPFTGALLLARIPRFIAMAYLGIRLGDRGWPFVMEHFWHLMGLAVVLFLVLFLAIKVMDRMRMRQLERDGVPLPIESDTTLVSD